MKKSGFLFAFALAIGFSSCKMAGDLQVEKRHYGKGYYVHMRNNHSDVALPENTTTQADENTARENKIENPGVVAEKNSRAQPTNSILAGDVKTKNPKHHSALNPIENKKTNPVKNKVGKVIAAIKNPDAPAGDTNQIILVILAIFISPLAVFLKEGVTNRFWIDLICWIIGGGFFLTPYFYGGLLLLFAVVFAILIVLGAI